MSGRRTSAARACGVTSGMTEGALLVLQGAVSPIFGTTPRGKEPVEHVRFSAENLTFLRVVFMTSTGLALLLLMVSLVKWTILLQLFGMLWAQTVLLVWATSGLGCPAEP